MLASGEKYKNITFIWDTRASFSLTPFRSDFIDYVEVNIPVKDVTKVNRIIVIGEKFQKIVDVNGQVCYLPYVSYHLLSTDVLLFSPHTYQQIHGVSSEVFGGRVIMKSPNHCIEIPINV